MKKISIKKTLIRKPINLEIRLKEKRLNHSLKEKPTAVFFATKFFQGLKSVLKSVGIEKK